MTKNGLTIPIVMPQGTEQYEEDLKLFIHEMLAKLWKHRDKGHWEDIDIPTALRRMREEIDELEEAIKNNDYAEIHQEAADVANFALILSSVLRRKSRNDQLSLFFEDIP